MHTVAILALDGLVLFDLSVPMEVFGRARLPDGRPAYRVITVAEEDEVDAGPVRIRVGHGLDALAHADTIMVAGTADVARHEVSGPVREALQSASRHGTRVASLCSGAFILGAVGLLDGRRATTHWGLAGELARRFPEVDVDPTVLYVDEGSVLTSAGAAAGLDLCLHMVRRDHGAAVAADAARLSVMPLERAGGQAQFIIHEPPAADGRSMQPLMQWLEDNLERPLSLKDLAHEAGVSVRTLSRRFQEQTGTTPLQWLHHARLVRAQYLLEATDHTIERIAGQVGFPSPTTFRTYFRRVLGVSPQSYRNTFRQGDAGRTRHAS